MLENLTIQNIFVFEFFQKQHQFYVILQVRQKVSAQNDYHFDILYLLLCHQF